MKLNTFLFCLFTTLTSFTYAQVKLNGRFLVAANDGINYSVKVQINTDTENNYLGSSNLKFSYWGDISYPQDLVSDIDYAFHNFNGENYTEGRIVKPSADQISINIDLNNPNTGNLIAQSPDWTDVVTLNFTIDDPEGQAILTWDTSATVIFSDDETTILKKGNFSNTDDFIPVELTSFTSSVINGKVSISWKTATETNNAGFDIERASPVTALDGSSASPGRDGWVKIGYVPGYGTTTESKIYSFVDNSVTAGEYRYRLKQIDFNGSFWYSKAIEAVIGLPEKFILEQNYPNPFNPSTTIRFALPLNAEVNIKLYNALGQKAANILNSDLDAGTHEIPFNAVMANLSSGVYFYRLEAKSIDGSVFVDTKRMVMIK